MNKSLVFVVMILIFLFFQFNLAYGQKDATIARTSKMADSLYKAKQYAEAGKSYSALAEMSDFHYQKASAYYGLACSLGLARQNEAAFSTLQKAVKAGYAKKSHILSDPDLASLHQLPGWTELVNSVPEAKRVLNADPAQAKFITTDIHHFWQAYDQALKDTLHFHQIMKRGYFDLASQGMNDYMGLKVSSIDYFVQHIRSAPAFYSSIRANSLKVDTYKPSFLAACRKLKSIYADAVFPDVYFVIGAFTSGGTVSDRGLLLGLNQSCVDSTVPLGELSPRLRTRVNPLYTLPNLVAHELIHYQQDGMKRDTTTLSFVIKEGMADFLAELISGAAPNPALYAWAKGRERAIWQKFKKDMYYNRYGNWIANSQQATADNLPDQGYWIGYQICRSYYQQRADKKKAIYEMLHIQDYQSFLAESNWEHTLSALSSGP
ncbi:MAG TPA: DUF2268 domain-containing putative Zn-dependent protease [Paludibacter sp.]|nr:DUF2268 domain-containing putative Zn-dependent protease [Paludibacter sp.]